MNYLSANVRRCRFARGWTQNELAERAGLSRATIAAIEGGRYRSPAYPTMLAIAVVFRTTVDALQKRPKKRAR